MIAAADRGTGVPATTSRPRTVHSSSYPGIRRAHPASVCNTLSRTPPARLETPPVT